MTPTVVVAISLSCLQGNPDFNVSLLTLLTVSHFQQQYSMQSRVVTLT